MTRSFRNLLASRESVDVEFKKAAGRDGCGTIPLNVWETVSAMANTNGGIIVLGAEELADDTYQVVPGLDVERMRTEFWSAATTPDKIKPNVFSNENVRIESLDGGDVLVIEVPRAGRKQRPVYLNGNPLTGTWRRFHEGDHRASESDVRRLIIEAERDTLDDVPVESVTFKDLEASSIDAYRQELVNENSEHPFLKGDNEHLLTSIGALAESPDTGNLVATRAGVLMFGNWNTLRPNFPHYDVDYHLVVDDDPKVRWTQRITTDGTWSGNLYDFYRRASNAITKEMRVPFKLNEEQVRIAEGPEHPALREALVNTLIHADYDSRTHIVVRQTSDEIMFRNGGTLRMPVDVAMAGGRSDCRNMNLQKMFQLVGYGEKLDSGFPLIRAAWNEKGWVEPRLEDLIELDSVELHLRFGPEGASLSGATGQVAGQATGQAELTSRQHETLAACDGSFLTVTELLQAIGLRSRQHFTTNVLPPLVEREMLELRFPDRPTHPDQAYRTSSTGQAALAAK